MIRAKRFHIHISSSGRCTSFCHLWVDLETARQCCIATAEAALIIHFIQRPRYHYQSFNTDFFSGRRDPCYHSGIRRRIKVFSFICSIIVDLLNALKFQLRKPLSSKSNKHLPSNANMPSVLVFGATGFRMNHLAHRRPLCRASADLSSRSK